MARLFVVLLAARAAVVIALAAESGAPVPALDPSRFTAEVVNPYFDLPLGKKLVYREDSDEGSEITETMITSETQILMGVETRVYLDRVFLNGELVEESRSYLAQDRGTGDVWYFGEAVDVYENGTLRNDEGSWIAGENGAQPGISFKGSPALGDEYLQQDAPGVAQDTVKIISVGVTLTTEAGTFADCVETFDRSKLDIDAREHKYYCRDAAAIVRIVDLEEGDRTDLVSIDPAP